MTAERPVTTKANTLDSTSEQHPARAGLDEPHAGRRAVKVSLVDNHLFIRTGLKMLIESRPGMKVVGASSDCRTAGGPKGREAPDVILLNVEPGEECRLACVAELFATYAGTKVLVASDIRRPEFVVECMRAGASGFITKDAEPELLFKAIEKVHAGELWFERSTISAMLSAVTRRDARSQDPDELKIASLTTRELEVIELVGQGLKNRQIADRLYICEATVSHHLTSIFSKLDLTDRLALVIYAYQHGLAKLPDSDQ